MYLGLSRSVSQEEVQEYADLCTRMLTYADVCLGASLVNLDHTSQFLAHLRFSPSVS
jgi:hypothetical protein